jgi:16S rRNA (cytosine967-C5)-methyltransferase
LNYTISALNIRGKLGSKLKTVYLFLIYRYYYENATVNEFISDITTILSKREDLNTDHIRAFYNKLQTFSWKKAFSNKSKLEKVSIDKAIPSFFLKKLRPYMSEDFLLKNVDFMNNYKDVDTGILILSRENQPISDLKDLFKEFLSDSNIPFENDPQIESMIIIPSNYISIVLNSRFYKDGQILILDKGSAYIANLILYGGSGYFLDMCAAPGMKTICLTHNIQDRHRIIAADFRIDRVYEMQNLLNIYNLSDISILNTDSIDFPLRKGCLFDAILLDAPCTGSGTFSSNPELKWRQNPSFLHQNTTLQEKLLNSAIKLLKPDGTLIYSTCSLYAQEGELQIEKRIDELCPLSVPEYFDSSYKINGKTIPGTGRLYPATHNSKGFFVGIFKKMH